MRPVWPHSPTVSIWGGAWHGLECDVDHTTNVIGVLTVSVYLPGGTVIPGGGDGGLGGGTGATGAGVPTVARATDRSTFAWPSVRGDPGSSVAALLDGLAHCTAAILKPST